MREYKSKVDIVYETLMEDIVNGVYHTNDRLIVSQIAKHMHVSDIPVREALRRLESLGYVRINANQGAVVSSIDKDDIISMFQIKGVLEGYASRLSIDFLTAKDLKKLHSINEKIKDAGLKGDSKKYSDLNMKFHLTVYSVIPQKMLYNTIVDLWQKWTITKSVFTVSPKRMNTSYLEHEEIITMLENKDYDGVETFVRSHKITAGYEWANMVKLSEKMSLEEFE